MIDFSGIYAFARSLTLVVNVHLIFLLYFIRLGSRVNDCCQVSAQMLHPNGGVCAMEHKTQRLDKPIFSYNCCIYIVEYTFKRYAHFRSPTNRFPRIFDTH